MVRLHVTLQTSVTSLPMLVLPPKQNVQSVHINHKPVKHHVTMQTLEIMRPYRSISPNCMCSGYISRPIRSNFLLRHRCWKLHRPIYQSSQSQCSAGTYQPLTGQVSCNDADAGYFCKQHWFNFPNNLQQEHTLQHLEPLLLKHP